MGGGPRGVGPTSQSATHGPTANHSSAASFVRFGSDCAFLRSTDRRHRRRRRSERVVTVGAAATVFAEPPSHVSLVCRCKGIVEYATYLRDKVYFGKHRIIVMTQYYDNNITVTTNNYPVHVCILAPRNSGTINRERKKKPQYLENMYTTRECKNNACNNYAFILCKIISFPAIIIIYYTILFVHIFW